MIETTHEPPSRRAALPTTSYAVLGLLSLAPMSGYDLTQTAAASIRGFWPISKSQVYGELARLEKLRLVEGRDIGQDRLPDKREYQLTTDGESRLDDWLRSPGFEPSRFRIPFLVKTMFAHRMSRAAIREHLAAYARAAEEDRKETAKLIQQLDEIPKAAFARATALYLLRVAQAQRDWAEEVRNALPPAPIWIDPRRPSPKKATMLFHAAPGTRRS